MSDDPVNWSDDDVLYALSLLGSEAPGHLLVGEAAARKRLEHVQTLNDREGPYGIADHQLVEAYARLAAQALELGVAGSSAGGEFRSRSGRLLNSTFVGPDGRPWEESVRPLTKMGWITGGDLGRIGLLGHFGQLIGNSDMHDGNLSFQPTQGRRPAHLQLAPIYDMLPMTRCAAWNCPHTDLLPTAALVIGERPVEAGCSSGGRILEQRRILSAGRSKLTDPAKTCGDAQAVDVRA
ncbi:hypothetical protein [Variovorax sp. 770b2]|uniref:hypothetical protein n=1 Tax=Variovorax sp. 770b2 TaxID=1566271 RepID=UPI000B333755|nr:hypothetical protein [Variovorax sp. 770b2]